MFCLDQGVPLPRPAQAEVRLQASSPPERVGLQPHSQRATVASRTPMGSFEIRTLRPLSRKNESLSGTGTVTEATKSPSRSGSLSSRYRWFESISLQRQVRRTPARTGEVPSDLEVVRYWDLAATERGPSVSSPMARARTGIATSTPRQAGSFPTNCLVYSTHGLASGCCGTRRCRSGEAAHSA